jgi:hypothetical protein
MQSVQLSPWVDVDDEDCKRGKEILQPKCKENSNMVADCRGFVP